MKRKPKIKIADLIRKDRGEPWPYRYDTGWVTVKDWQNMPAQSITVRVPAEWVRPYCAHQPQEEKFSEAELAQIGMDQQAHYIDKEEGNDENEEG